MTQPLLPEPELRHTTARDGTPIAWHSYAPSAGRSEPAVILTNGLGTTANFWKDLVRGLAPDRTVVHWDYRGHGASGVSQTRDYSIATQADDLARVTEATLAGLASLPSAGAGVVQVGFSMGVTVVLELYRRRPELVRAMVLIAGGADFPYAASALFRVPGARAVFRGGLAAIAPVFPRLSPILKRASRSPAIYSLGRLMGAVNEDAPRSELEHFFHAVGDMDGDAYWSSLRGLFGSHASDVLPLIQVPVLVVAPGWDLMAPEADLDLLRRRIPGVQWLQIPGTGHAVLLEAGQQVAAGVSRFLATLGGGRA